MGSFFHWFYCLPLEGAVLLLLVLAALFLIARSKLEKFLLWKIVVAIGFLVWLAAVLYTTLWNRSEADAEMVFLVPFHSYRELMSGGNTEIIRSNLMNILLFFPGALLLISSVPSKQRNIKTWLMVVLGLMILSAAIELAQYVFTLGRVEMDDVIHNTLGGAVGGLLGLLRLRLRFQLKFR